MEPQEAPMIPVQAIEVRYTGSEINVSVRVAGQDHEIFRHAINGPFREIMLSAGLQHLVFGIDPLPSPFELSSPWIDPSSDDAPLTKRPPMPDQTIELQLEDITNYREDGDPPDGE